ncbi:MAG: hypothetical protein JXA35_06860 [Deltaproteobacteria bacterium]|nr:hypothetical protein [Deltaproteobacteria bacterium]
MKLQRFKIAFALIALLFILGATGCADKVKQFDRQSLVDLMQKYVMSLANHNPGDLPFAEDVKFTENSEKGIDVLTVGKGLWETATGGPTEFQIYAADPEAQAAACLLVMKEKDKDIMLGARIKLSDGKIVEAEHLVVRGGAMGGQPFSEMPTLKKARPGFSEDIPEAERMKRDDLLKIGLSYYDALTSEDGTATPFAKECERHENGMVTAGGTPPAPGEEGSSGGAMPTGGFGGIPMDCEGQISAAVFSYITEIKPRMVVADVQKGLAVGFSMFRHDGTKRLPEGAAPGTDNKTQWGQFNLAALHFYKIRNGKLYEIEAPGAMLPYGVKSGWEAEEKVFPQPK